MKEPHTPKEVIKFCDRQGWLFDEIVTTAKGIEIYYINNSEQTVYFIFNKDGLLTRVETA
jgi:hypothetical protein